MKNSKNFLTTKPILKPKPKQLILSIHPQPPTENRLPPNLERGNSPHKVPTRGKLPLRESIDYAKLTPTQQVKWDLGIYGSIQQKDDGYVVRWYDPLTDTKRSDKLGKTLPEAKAKLKQMVLGG
jgi:hypothetical protein